MNIFISSLCPYESARFLDDKRVNKMLLETTQMLSTIMTISGDSRAPYKPTHRNHPCTKWASKNNTNSYWLLRHYRALCREYTARFNKTHKCESYQDIFNNFFTETSEEPSEFFNCTPYLDQPITVAYQLLLNDKWDNDKRTPLFYGKAI